MNKSFNDFKEERANHWKQMRGRKADGSERVGEAK